MRASLVTPALRVLIGCPSAAFAGWVGVHRDEFGDMCPVTVVDRIVHVAGLKSSLSCQDAIRDPHADGGHDLAIIAVDRVIRDALSDYTIAASDSVTVRLDPVRVGYGVSVDSW